MIIIPFINTLENFEEIFEGNYFYNALITMLKLDGLEDAL